MKKGLRLRSRLYLTIMPLVIVVIFLNGFVAALESRASLTRLANKHLAYKSEQLRDFFYSEWDVLNAIGLGSEREYRAASEEAFRSYAYSLLRSPTERVLAFDRNGSLIFQASLGSDYVDSQAEGDSISIAPGWFEATLFGELRVGVAFELEPIQWTVALTELQSSFLLDAKNMQYTIAGILAAAIIVMTIFLSLYLARIIRPLESLTGAIGRISTDMNFDQKLTIEFDDEIGRLAFKFNEMVHTLQENYHRLQETMKAEKSARDAAVAQEEETLFLLSKVSDFRDEETGEHLKRIGALSALFAELLGQDHTMQKLIRYSSPLHDIGKIGITDAILRKPGKLSTAEFEEIKRHTVLGYEILKNTHSIYLSEGATIALTHHERWDGSGYPTGLKGEDIPLSGRIVSIIDVYDALCSQRPYKEAWTPERAMDYIAGQGGKHFDPNLVKLFVEHSQRFIGIIDR